MKIPELDPFRSDLETYVTSVATRMGQSSICLTLFTENYAKALDSLLQFSVAMMMDKPIYILAERGVRVPDNVTRVARAIEYYNPGDKASMSAATTRLLVAAGVKAFGA